MVKVVHLTSVHLPDDIRIFYKELCTLSAAGFSMVLIASGKKIRNLNKEIRFIYTKRYKNRFLRMTITCWEMYKLALKEKADVYHFHDSELLWVGLLLKKRGAKVIYDSHENTSQQILNKIWIAEFFRKIMSYCFFVFETFIVKRLDYIIAATPSIKNHFYKNGINRCVDVNNYPIIEEFVNSNEFNTIENQICYVGGISKTRGIEQMISAIDALNDIKLVLAGKFETPKLREKCIELSGWTRVIELGFVSRKKVQEIMSQSRIGLLLLHPIDNYIDSYPIKLFEYMLSEIPVIASDFPLWRSIVEKNNCGICVDPLDLKAITKAIKYIISHPQKAKDMGKNGRNLVLNKFNWSSEAAKLLNVYKKIFKC